MMFEEAVMRFCGVENIPSFDDPTGKANEPTYHLGHACNGEQVENCLKFYSGFFKDFDQQQLGEKICIPKCRRS